MRKCVSVTEARQGLTQLLRDAHHKDEEIIVTYRGSPFMVILPYDEYQKLERLRNYLNMVRISEELKGKRISTAGLLKKSRRADEWYWSEEGQRAITEARKDIEAGKGLGPSGNAKDAVKALKKKAKL